MEQATKTAIAEEITKARLSIIEKFEHSPETEDACQSLLKIEGRLYVDFADLSTFADTPVFEGK